MRYRVLATDYDGTLATHGVVDAETIASLRRLVGTGRRLALVTGRLLHEVRRICAGIELFDVVVAEDGAVVWSRERDIEILAPPVSLDLVAALRRRHVTPLSVGRVICATWEDHEEEVADAIDELGLDVHLSHNKGSLMILPDGVDKGAGLRAAARHLSERTATFVAVGDAENDIPMLDGAGCSAAVGNALESVKAHADLVLSGRHGAGVRQVIDGMIEDDLVTMLAQARGEAAG